MSSPVLLLCNNFCRGPGCLQNPPFNKVEKKTRAALSIIISIHYLEGCIFRFSTSIAPPQVRKEEEGGGGGKFLLQGWSY